MATYGSYEAIAELYSTGFGAVVSARLATAEGKFIVKTFQPKVEIVDPGLIAVQVTSFLARAKLQQGVARDSKHWAKVHEYGSVNHGAYYVTDHYAQSVQRLISGKVSLGAAALYNITDGVVQGLRELKDRCKRAHGNLKASNILLTAAVGMENVQVALTDPAEQVSAQAESRDLYALGVLLYELVLRKPVRGLAAWPIPASDEWAALGQHGEGWRELCAGLINPSGVVFGLEGVAAAVRKLSAGKRRGGALAAPLVRHRKAVAAALVGACAVGGVVGWRAWGARQWGELTAAHQHWLGGLVKNWEQVDKGPAGDEGGGGMPLAELGKVMGEVQQGAVEVDPAKIAGPDAPAGEEKAPWAPAAVWRVRSALAVVHRAEAAVARERAELLRRLAGAQAQCGEYGFAAAEEVLRGVSDSAGGRAAEPPTWELVSRFGRVERRLGELVRAAKQLGEQVKDIKSADDRTLREFETFVRRELESVVPKEDRRPEDVRLAAVSEKMRELSRVAEPVVTVLQRDWNTRVDQAKFREETLPSRSGRDPSAGDFREWVTRVQKYCRVKLDGAGSDMAAARKLLTQTQNELEARRPGATPEAQRSVAVLEQELVQRRLAFDGLPVECVERDRQQVQGVVREVLADASDLLKRVQALPPARPVGPKPPGQGGPEIFTGNSVRGGPPIGGAGWAEVGHAEFVSVKAGAAWERWVRLRRVNEPATAEAPASVSELRESLLALEKSLGGVSEARFLSGEWADVALVERDRIFASVVTSVLQVANGEQDAALVESRSTVVCQEYRTLCGDLARLRDASGRVREKLDLGYGLNEVTELWQPWERSELLQSEAVAKVIQGEAKRINTLQEIDSIADPSRERERLEAWAVQGSLDAAVAAWRRLASAPPPAEAGRFRRLMEVCGKVSKAVARLGDGARREELSGELSGQCRALTKEFAGGARTLPQLTSAVEVLKQMGAEPALVRETTRRVGDAYLVAAAPNFAEAARCYGEAATGTPGDAKAMVALGRLYGRGAGVDRNAAKAVELFKGAAAAGEPDGMVLLGDAYRPGGLAGAPDAGAASEWYEKAAKQGSVEAMLRLGRMNLEDSAAIASAWFEKAQAAGDPRGLTGLGWVYKLHYLHLGRNAEDAESTWLLAAEENEAGALVALGQKCWDREDFAKARGYFERAAKLGDAEAQFRLAAMCESGKGGGVNREEAVKWRGLAERQGHGPKPTSYYIPDAGPKKPQSASAARGE